jgi:hypothetical protein
MGRVRIFLSNRFAWLSALAGAMIADRRLFSLVIRLFRCISSMLLLSFALQAQAGMATLSHEDQTLTVDGAFRTARVPKGYRLEWLGAMKAPRMLTFAVNGDLFAGSKSGKVYRLPQPYTPSI